MDTPYLTDKEIVEAKIGTQYPADTYIWYGVTEFDRCIADAATRKVLKVLGA